MSSIGWRLLDLNYEDETRLYISLVGSSGDAVLYCDLVTVLGPWGWGKEGVGVALQCTLYIEIWRAGYIGRSGLGAPARGDFAFLGFLFIVGNVLPKFKSKT